MRSSSRPTVYTDDTVTAHVIRWAPSELASQQMVDAGTRARDAEVQRLAAIELAEQERLEQEQRIQDARLEGYEEGRAQGEAAERERLRDAVLAAEAALETIRENEAKWQECVTENISALAVAVARHVIGRELNTDITLVADLVRRALAEFPIDQAMRIRVNPVDLSMFSVYVTPEGEPLSIAPNRDVRWLADSRIQQGGCVVEGRERIVDGRVDTALERMYRRLSNNNA